VNEIVYDSQRVIERKFYVLVNSFCLFNVLIPPLGGGKEEVLFLIY